jgi:hypothetical protein
MPLRKRTIGEIIGEIILILKAKSLFDEDLVLIKERKK